MKGTEKRLILISLTLALLAALSVFVYLRSLKVTEVTIPKIKMIVAAVTLPPRTLITEKMTIEIEVPQNEVKLEYISDITKIIGSYTKETILKNEGFIKEKLLNENENNNELSLKIDEKHRAISINANVNSGVAGLLKPGDFVDVLILLQEKKEGQKIIWPQIAKILFQNLEILAIDRQLSRENKLKEEAPLPTTFLVTLSVPVLDVEKLVLSEVLGTFKLALRPLKKEPNVKTNGATASNLLSETPSSLITSNKDIKVNKETTIKNVDINTQEKYKFTSYKIKYLDTLKSISNKYYGKPDNYLLLKEINNIKDENILTVGKTIKLPILPK